MKSFAIISDTGIALDVATDSKLTVEFVAATFNEDTMINGSFSYPIIFPLTEKNKRFFGHGHHLENRLARKDVEVTISLLGMPWKKAKLSYEVSRNGYEAVLKVDNSTVAQWMRERTIAEVFTISNNGKFVKHREVFVGADPSQVQEVLLQANANVASNIYALPTYINTMVTGEAVGVNDAIINDFSNVAGVNSFKPYTPFFYLTYVIKEVCKFLGFEAKGTYLDDEFVQSLIIDNTGTRSGRDLLSSGKLYPAQHLPALSIADFFKALRNDHRVMIYFDSLNKIIRFDEFTQFARKPYRLDVSESIHFDTLKIKKSNATAYRLITKTDDADDLYNYIPYVKSVTVGFSDEVKEIPMSIGIPYMRKGEFKTFADVRCPIRQQIGNLYGSDYYELESPYNKDNEFGKNAFAFRLLSYKGLEYIDATETYRIPFATPEAVGNLDKKYTQALTQGGEVGIIQKYSYDWYAFYCLSEQVEFTANLNVVEFFQINPLQKLLIADRNRAKIEAYMDKVVFEPSSNGRDILAKINCYPNYNLNAVAGSIHVLVDEAEDYVPDGKLYVKVYMLNVRDGDEPTSQSKSVRCDVVIEFYQDRGCTIQAPEVDNIEWRCDREDIQSSSGNVCGRGTFLGHANTWRSQPYTFAYYFRYKYQPNVFFVDSLYYFSDPTNEKFEVVGHYRQVTTGSEIQFEGY